MFTKDDILILVEMLKNNHLKLGEEDDIAYIGYIIRHLNNSLSLPVGEESYAIEPALSKDYMFFNFITRELEWLSENEMASNEVLNVCEKLFETFMPSPDKYESEFIYKFIL